VWVSEYRWEAIAPLTDFALATERMKIGSAIIPIYSRSATALAMTAANLAQLAPDRLLFGLGTSTDVIIEGWHGRKRERPLQAIREYIEAIRVVLASVPIDGNRILEGEAVHFEGEIVTVDGFQLDRRVSGRVDLYAAALGEKMLQVAGQVADGALLNLTPHGHLPKIRSTVEEAAAEAGRDPGSVALCGDVLVAIAEGEEAAEIREEQRAEIAIYARQGPYSRFFSEAGFPKEAAAIRAAWERRDRDAAAAAVTDEMLDSIVVVGDADHVRERVEHLLGAGYDTLIAVPLSPRGGDPDVAARLLIDVLAGIDTPRSVA
ncbi:MAG TPA: LLM class flavin-dependent oxidoreductase, partial [Solirubrobacterales bacterium]